MLELTLLLQSTTSSFNTAATGTGLEWMTIMSVVAPAVVLVAILYAGTKRTVR